MLAGIQLENLFVVPGSANLQRIGLELWPSRFVIRNAARPWDPLSSLGAPEYSWPAARRQIGQTTQPQRSPGQDD
jgi:hypothetical protein